MRRSKPIIATGAVLVSCALHAAGLGYGIDQREVAQEGGAPVAAVRLGNSFENMVSGATTPAQQPETKTTAPPAPTLTRGAPATASIVTANAVKTPSPRAVSGSLSAHTPAPDIIAPVVVAAATPQKSAMEQTSAHQTSVDQTAASPRATSVVANPPLEAQTPNENTPRPQIRPDRPKTPEQPPPSRQGGDQDRQRGQDTGVQNAAAQQASRQQQAKAQAAGNAAAANYGGIVMGHLSRIRRQRAPARGEATVAFHIGANGAVSRVRIARSSGHAALDAAAIAHIQRAAPFPAPPPGAQRDFGYIYVGRK